MAVDFAEGTANFQYCCTITNYHTTSIVVVVVAVVAVCRTEKAADTKNFVVAGTVVNPAVVVVCIAAVVEGTANFLYNYTMMNYHTEDFAVVAVDFATAATAGFATTWAKRYAFYF